MPNVFPFKIDFNQIKKAGIYPLTYLKINFLPKLNGVMHLIRL